MDLARERGPVLQVALRTLPLELLEALLRGVHRHGDSLAPGSLHRGRGGCAVGMMLHELRGTRPGWRLRWRSPTIHEDAPELARKYPRLAHVEFIFDRTCDALAERRGVEPCDVATDVGRWMGAAVEAEISVRRPRCVAVPCSPTRRGRTATPARARSRSTAAHAGRKSGD
jgi:hypothetical protein